MTQTVPGRTAALIAVLSLVSCAGPAARVTIGGKALPIEVAFGRPAPEVVPRIGREPTTVVPVPGGVGVIPVPSKDTGGSYIVPGPKPGVVRPVPKPPACAPVPPGRFPDQAVMPDVNGLPVAGAYLVRYVADVTEDGKERHIEGTGVHTVKNVQPVPGGRGGTFDMTVQFAGAEVTYTYGVQPPPNPNQLPVGAPTTGQINLRKASGDGGLGYQAVFEPTTPIQVFPLPAFTNQTWSSSGVDAASQTTASVNGKVVAGDVVINACGTPVATWKTEATLAIESPNQDVQVTLVDYFATQHGGLPVAETQTYTGTAGGVPVSGTVSWTFNQAPKAPA